VTGLPQKKEAANEEQPAKKYWQLEGFQELFVDDDNQLYSNRPYQGIIPRLRDELEVLRAPKEGGNVIMWVGYQHRKLFSRVFVQTSHMPVFTVQQRTPTHLVITFDKASFRDSNARREIFTGDFNTRVTRVVPQLVGKDKAEVHVYLRDAGSFLYRQEQNYLYLDVERSESE
jgi:hypothetical protein